ncbi:MAG: S49 family peptidase [Parachlamydiales bacterium]|nr:S49 family peptidase [Parachlamydiales bacterium]
MEFTKESIFISSIRSFFSTLLGTIGIFIAFIPIFIILSMFSSGKEDIFKTKLEILPDHLGNMKILGMSTPAVLQVNISGIIGIDGGIKSQDIEYQLLESRKGILKNNRVKAVLLNINTRGGDVIDADTIYRELMYYKEKYKVPVYAYTNGFCASGGMYIACAADKIYSSPVSIIGSIGVISGPFFNFYDTMQKIGIQAKTISEGKDKDALSPFRKWKEKEGESFEELTEHYYKMFVNLISTSRNIDKDKIINEYGARVFNAEKAKEIGYIDNANSNYKEALVELLKEAKLDPEKSYQVVSLIPKRNWFTQFSAQSKMFFKGILTNLFSNDQVDDKSDRLYYLYKTAK